MAASDSRRKSLLVLLVFLGISFGVAAAGSVITTVSMPVWYDQLEKPEWTPPSWVFGPVWSVLYAAMAVAAWLVWRQRGMQVAAPALMLYFIQLLLNFGWTVAFFGLRSPGAGLVEITFLWVAVLATLIYFWRLVLVAGLLFVPYLLWVTFAAALNFGIWRLN